MMDPLQLLDYQCWAEVLKRLEPEDLLSVRDVCKLFSRITSDVSYGFQEEKWKFSLVLPHLLPYLRIPVFLFGSRLVLKPRLVCKSWCDSFDRGHQQQIPYLRFQTAERIDEFMEYFWGSKALPILFSRLELWRKAGEDNARFQQSAMLFVQTFGMDIWDLIVYDKSPSFLQLLQYTPNVKSVNFNTYSGHDEDDQVLPALPPLPDLPYFKALTIMCEPQPIINHILSKYGPQLSHLLCYGPVAFTKLTLEEHGILIQSFGLLKSLEISANGYTTATFAALQSLTCPLETLKIDLNDDLDEPWRMDLFLKSIRHFPLQNLSISIRSKVTISSGELAIEDYSNPTITDFQLNNWNWMNNQISFNFLQAFTHLETFTFDCRAGKVNHFGLEKEVDFLDSLPLNEVYKNPRLYGPYYVYQSNVWEKVKSLKKVRLGTGFFIIPQFSREGYEAFRNI